MELTAIEMLPLDIPTIKATEGFWYLGTPYTKYPAGVQIAFEHACIAAAHLVERGVHVFCPIAYTHPVAQHGAIDPVDVEIWLPVEESIMATSQGLIVCKMPTWEESLGLSIEAAYFADRERPIYEMHWPLV
jgi:hypothetical protein